MKCQIMVNFILKYVNFILQKKNKKKTNDLMVRLIMD